MLSGLPEGCERLLCVLHQRVLWLLLDEILEARGGPCPLAERRACERAAEHGIGGKGAARVVLEERLERLGRVGVATRVGERLCLLERLPLACLLALAPPVGLELRLGGLGAAQSGGHGHASCSGVGARPRRPQPGPPPAEHVPHCGRPLPPSPRPPPRPTPPHPP